MKLSVLGQHRHVCSSCQLPHHFGTILQFILKETQSIDHKTPHSTANAQTFPLSLSPLLPTPPHPDPLEPLITQRLCCRDVPKP